MTTKPLASRLIGKKIGKWNVLNKRQKTDEDPSGFFSTCYTVEDDHGNLAFMKAFNYVYAFRAGMSADLLKELTENFTYERDLLMFCRENRMRRVVTAIDSGEYSEPNELISVPYLVFEIAQGSLKNFNVIRDPSLAWRLRAFHGTLVGLSQLHKARIAHQDIKPSNILIFGNDISKLGDLGNATQQFNESVLWSKDSHCGDMRYAPVELLYGYFSPDWNVRRYGADLFMMGGLLTYMICETNFVLLMHTKIPEPQRYNNFGGTFDEIKPFLYSAFHETLNEIRDCIPKLIRDDLIAMLSELCNPIPEERGNTSFLDSTRNQYSLEKYISVTDRLSKKLLWTPDAEK